jgi:hypothetical protein
MRFTACSTSLPEISSARLAVSGSSAKPASHGQARLGNSSRMKGKWIFGSNASRKAHAPMATILATFSSMLSIFTRRPGAGVNDGAPLVQRFTAIRIFTSLHVRTTTHDLAQDNFNGLHRGTPRSLDLDGFAIYFRTHGMWIEEIHGNNFHSASIQCGGAQHSMSWRHLFAVEKVLQL